MSQPVNASKWSTWLRWSRKPSRRDFKTFTKKTNECSEKAETTRTLSVVLESDSGIPEELSIEQVLENKTCSPLALNDFYMYLKHVECSQENLEFYTWYKNYENRYMDTSASSIDTCSTFSEIDENCIIKTVCEVVEYEDECQRSKDETEFAHYVESLVLNKGEIIRRPGRKTWARPFSFRFSDSLLFKSYTNRLELQIIADLFLRQGSLKELNLPPSMRKRALAAIRTSDSPATLAAVAEHVFHLLRSCSFPNFLNLGIQNGTSETLCVATFLGAVLSATGFLTMLLLALASPSIHQSSRWRGLAAAPFWFNGFTLLFCGLRGCCFILLLFKRRQKLPWERLMEQAEQRYDSKENDQTGATTSTANPLRRFLARLMVFEHKLSIRDQSLRTLQHRILIESLIGAAVATIVLEVVFLSLPVWR